LMCVFYVPNTAVFFAIASKTLIHFYTRETLNARGFDFGFLLERLMKELYFHFLKTKDGQRSKHWEHFHDFRECKIKFKKMKRKAWNMKCMLLLKIILRLWNHYEVAPPSSQVQSVYSTSLQRISKLVYGDGPLTSTHAFRIAAHIGLFPSWIAGVAKLEASSKSCLWLYKQFPKHASHIAAEPDTFLASLTYYLQQNNQDEHITLGTVENCLCKVKRLFGKQNTDSKFWDVFEIEQDVYEFLSDEIRIHSSNGRTSVVSGNAMIKKWPVSTAQLMSMRRIAALADVPKTMKLIDEHKIPNELWNDLINVNFPANYNADGMVVPPPVIPKFSNLNAHLGAKFIEIAFRKLNDN